MRDRIIIGTRASKLAVWQAEHIAGLLRKRYANMEIEVRHIATTGDKILDVPLAKIGGKGLFTKELEVEMRNGRIDLAVHSLKDMPTSLPEGLILSAVTKRVDPGDALVSPKYGTLARLPQGAKVGTSSLRRRAQLLAVRPDLDIRDLRGNVGTRLEKLESQSFDAIVLAVAGLKRLGLADQITQVLPREICLPAVGQGALAIESRADDEELAACLAFLNDAETVWAAQAERAFLAEVEGGCQVPVGVYAVIEEGLLRAEAVIASLDGTQVLRDTIEGAATDAETLGTRLAARMLASGGRALLAEIVCMESNH